MLKFRNAFGAKVPTIKGDFQKLLLFYYYYLNLFKNGSPSAQN
jgi:hypothetical protein